MASSTPTLNSTAVSPSQITRSRKKYGSVNQAANGTRTWTHRGEKSEWELQFDDVALAVLTTLTTIYNLTTTFAFTDEEGNSFTVQCQEDSLEWDVVQFGASRSYNVTLRLYEA